MEQEQQSGKGAPIDLNPGIEARLVEDLYFQAPAVILGGILLMAINAAFYLPLLPAQVNLPWFVLLLIATGGRAFSYRRYRRRPAAQPVPRWHRELVLWSVFLGGGWAVLVLAAVVMLPPEHSVVALVTVAGVSGSATATSSASPLVFRTVAALALGPLAVTLLLSDDAAYRFIGLMTVSYLLVLSRASTRIHQTLRQSVMFGLRNEDLVRTLAHQSTVDSLTGLSNRRALTQGFQDAWALGEKHGRTVGLILCDIDHFKQYNDLHGHLEGDRCLKAVAGALKRATRSGDQLTARYGGEEFAVLLQDCDRQQLERVGERLRRSVLALAIPHGSDAAGPVVTISVGASLLVPSPQLPVDELIKASDTALYQAKAAGRNRLQIDEGLAAVVTG
ncbi:MAG: diguanylate cyclase [Pseudomonadota bacterium]